MAELRMAAAATAATFGYGGGSSRRAKLDADSYCAVGRTD
jgi:hypothetical protein